MKQFIPEKFLEMRSAIIDVIANPPQKNMSNKDLLCGYLGLDYKPPRKTANYVISAKYKEIVMCYGCTKMLVKLETPKDVEKAVELAKKLIAD